MSRESLAIIRAVLGLVQGAALYLLYNAFDTKIWPATHGQVFAPLVLTAVFVPTLAVAALGNLRQRTFAMWIGVAIVVAAALGAYDIFHDPAFNAPFDTRASSLRNLPSAALWFAVAAGLFIAHALIVSGDADRAFVATYPRYFDVAWKHGVQAVLAAAFVGAMWAVLFLGASLFQLIKIDFLTELLKKPWFSIPVTAVAVTVALHVTDVQAGLVRGVRTLKLTLLSWLLPLIVLIAAGFLAALLFTGLEPLWGTRRATALVLLTAAVLIMLLNAAYQDGAHPVAHILKYAGAGAAAVLTPLVAIAAYAVMLRVNQYGWTPERIVAATCIIVAASYTAGYAVALATSPLWLQRIETTNVVTAVIILAVILALFSPLADPARLAVMDQVARLEMGRTPVDQFDFAFLRFRSGRYGVEALARLKDFRDGPDAARVAEKAATALAWKYPAEAAGRVTFATPASRAERITVAFPNGQTLPDSFLQQDWTNGPDVWRLPYCLRAMGKCDAVMTDLDGDGTPEILLFEGASATAYRQSAASWVFLGAVLNVFCKKDVMDALRSGRFDLVPPEIKDVEVAGQRLWIARVATCR
jgi:Domain of unknown function (DUF4153)